MDFYKLIITLYIPEIIPLGYEYFFGKGAITCLLTVL